MKARRTLIDKAFLLKKTAIFSSLDIDLLLTIADKMDVETYKKGSKIFQIGQDASRIYIVVEGSLHVKNKADLLLAELVALDFFGDEAVLGEKTRGYDVICQSDLSLLSLTATHLHAILMECPTVAASFLEAYASNCEFR